MTQTNPTNVVCKVKAALAECGHYRTPSKHEHSKDNAQHVQMFLMIPLDEQSIETETKGLKSKSPLNAPTTVQCSKHAELKFPEMRNGILFSRCYCVHRNGLQDCCPLNQCQGQQNCLRKPWPNCLPAKYLQSRHPQQYPPSN